MATRARDLWKKDGIRGFDKIIRVKGKLYELWSTRSSSSYAGLARARRSAENVGGTGCKVYRISNTYGYAIYIPYSGSKRPINRS